MKLETFTSQSKETYLEAKSVIVTVNTWANLEGASIMVHGKGPELPMRMAGSFLWEELDAIIVALAAARASETKIPRRRQQPGDRHAAGTAMWPRPCRRRGIPIRENHELIPTIKRGFGQPAANQS